jgi:tetratricopeptide (TPR) repeat protein
MNQPDDSDRLGQILQELIIADLSDIADLKVFSSQRLFDIQKQLGSENRSSIDPNLATDIARRAGAEALLTGKIIQRENGLMLTSQLININDGSVLKSYQVDGSDIYQMVDNLTGLIQTDIRIPEDESDTITDAVADKTSSSVNAFQYYFNGVDYFNKSHFKEAIVEFKNAIAIDSTFSSAYYKLAMAQWWSQSELSTETIEDAQASLQKVLNGQWYKTTKEKLLAQGALELTRQNFIEAESLYKQLIDFIDDEKEAWYGLGEAYFHGNQNFDLAKDAFERAIELDPAFTVAYRHIFDIYTMNKEYDSGIIRATQLIDSNPENVWGYIFLSNMLIGKKDYERAKDVLEDAIELDPELTQIYYSFTKVYRELEQFDEGIEFINGLRSVSDLPGKYEFLASMYIGKRQFENAIDIYERLLTVYPDNYHTLLMIGFTYLLDGKYQLAINHCERIRNEYPNLWDIKGKQLLITVYNELGRYSDTIEIMENMLINIQENELGLKSDMLNNLAYYSYLVGDLDKADKYINDSVSSTESIEENLVSYLIRSFVLSKSNNLAGLLELKNTVSDTVNTNSINPDLKIIAHAVNFKYYFTSRDYTKAIEEFNLMDPDNQITERFYYLAGIAYFELEEFEKVEELISKMRDISLNHNIRAFLYPRSYLLSGLINEANGNMNAAKNDYQRQLDIWQDGDKSALDYQIVLQRYNSI